MGSDVRSSGELPTLSFDMLRAAVVGDANYLRVRTVLQPADGDGKVYPPTYQGPEGSRRSDVARYHIEQRRQGGEVVWAAVLDSVASQANRAEEALLDAYADGRLRVPLVVADFSEDGGCGYEGVLGGWLTSLEASHRVADAAFRECKLGGVFFRESPVGRRVFASTERHAADMYRYCPTVLVFGEWDSMGGDASRGHKFERRVVSEIVAVGVVVGRASSSKLDPLRVESAAVYENRDHVDGSDAPGWTTDESKAVRNAKGKPVLFGRGEGKGKISGLGLGNVTPSIAPGPEDDVFTGVGGVTFERAEQSTVIALNSVRKLRFPRHREATVDARTAVAALALASTVLRDAQGYALRSRCLLVPDRPPTVELVDPFGEVRGFAPVTPDAALGMLERAVDAAAEAGLAWEAEPVVLTPTENLRDAVRARKARMSGEATGG